MFNFTEEINLLKTLSQQNNTKNIKEWCKYKKLDDINSVFIYFSKNSNYDKTIINILYSFIEMDIIKTIIHNFENNQMTILHIFKKYNVQTNKIYYIKQFAKVSKCKIHIKFKNYFKFNHILCSYLNYFISDSFYSYLVRMRISYRKNDEFILINNFEIQDDIFLHDFNNYKCNLDKSFKSLNNLLNYKKRIKALIFCKKISNYDNFDIKSYVFNIEDLKRMIILFL